MDPNSPTSTPQEPVPQPSGVPEQPVPATLPAVEVAVPPVQPVTPAQTVAVAPAPAAPVNTVLASSDVHTKMRSTILRIIAGLVLVSIIGVGLIFVLGNSSDSSVADREITSNGVAQYEVPTAWNSETVSGGAVAHYNGDTSQASQVTYFIGEPTRIKFSGEPLTKEETDLVFGAIATAYESDSDLPVTLSDSQTLTIDGFTNVLQFTVSGRNSADTHDIAGILRVYIDPLTYLHATSVTAIDAYWDKNQAELEAMIETYMVEQSS